MGSIFSFVGNLFGARQETSSGIQGMTAKDILPETKAKEPDSPVFGGSDTYDASQKGKEALKIGLDKAAKTIKGAAQY